MKTFVEVGAYLNPPVFGFNSSVEYIKKNKEENQVLGFYRNGSGLLEIGVTKIFDMPEKNTDEYNLEKEKISKKYPCEKEIFLANIIGYKSLKELFPEIKNEKKLLENYLQTIGNDDGGSLILKNNEWFTILVDYDTCQLDTMYPNRYLKIDLENITNEQINLLINNAEEYNLENFYHNEDISLYIAEDNKSGFIIDKKTKSVINVFSKIPNREQELLVAIKMATPNEIGLNSIDITPIITFLNKKNNQIIFDKKDLEIQQAVVEYNQTHSMTKTLLYSTMIDLKDLPKNYGFIKTKKEFDKENDLLLVN